MSYWQYWQLEAAPFAGDAAQRLFRGASVEEALARIEFLIGHRRRVGTLLGSSGVGKSTLMRHFALQPAISAAVPNLQVVKLSMLGMNGGELLIELAMRLTGNRKANEPISGWRQLCDFFTAASREDMHVLALIDDAESSTAAAESDLVRLLSMAFPLTAILGIETQLLGAVSRNLIDQTELQIELPSWEVEQTGEFLNWITSSLGREDAIFTTSAVGRIQQLSSGLPRRIVQLADLAMVAGAVSQADSIDAECIDQVAWELPRSNAA